MKIIWVLANCNTIKEAEIIGKKALKQRLISCFDIFPRQAAYYFWPPKTGKIEKARGCLLALETLPKYFSKIQILVKKTHSDKLPFIGSIEVKNVSKQYFKWIKEELH